MFRLVPLRLLVLGIIFTLFFLTPFELVLAQSVDEIGEVTGDAVNSKYVTIADHRYQHGETSDVITGTVRNNSTQEIPMISIIAVLYDKDNNLITTGFGSANTQDLPVGDNSTFSINFVLKGNVVDRYILFPGRIPQLS